MLSTKNSNFTNEKDKKHDLRNSTSIKDDEKCRNSTSIKDDEACQNGHNLNKHSNAESQMDLISMNQNLNPCQSMECI